VVYRSLELERLEGTAEGHRQTAPALVLSLELTNRCPSRTLTPLSTAFVRDSSPTDDPPYIELPGDRRISMFRLATESEWSIQDQIFPALQPGQTEETILASEPISLSDLHGFMTWYVKLRIGAHQTDVLGVRFTARQVKDESE
jgi:hypothetical protein